MLSFMNRNDSASARVVRWNKAPCLIATFKNSSPPLVWQMDLDKLTSYSLKLVEKEGEWDMGYDVPQGAFTIVAHFDERQEAELAYGVVSKALLSGANGLASSRRRGFGGWVYNIFALIGILAVLFVGGSVLLSKAKTWFGPKDSQTVVSESDLSSAQPPQSPAGEPTKEGAQAIKEETHPSKFGVPLNADDVLPNNNE